MGNTYGKLFRVTTFGESHGPAVGAVVDGCPSKISLTEAEIQHELDRRRPGQSDMTTARKEEDRVKILSGIFEGQTLGTPIAIIVENRGMRSGDYENIKEIYRPGHADYAWDVKFGIRDYRGGGRSSGRETIGRVMGGAVAKKILGFWLPRTGFQKKGVEIYAYATQVGSIEGEKVDLDFIEKNPIRAADPKKAKLMEEAVRKAKAEGDSLGGIVEILIRNVPAGLGEPVFDKINADLAKAIFSIPTVKALEFGLGKKIAALMGSQNNKIAAGISGGISTGSDLLLRVAVKPPSSIAKKQTALNRAGRKVDIQIRGRHDPCIIPRFIPVAESMVAMTLADHFLRYKAIKW